MLPSMARLAVADSQVLLWIAARGKIFLLSEDLRYARLRTVQLLISYSIHTSMLLQVDNSTTMAISLD